MPSRIGFVFITVSSTGIILPSSDDRHLRTFAGSAASNSDERRTLVSRYAWYGKKLPEVNR